MTEEQNSDLRAQLIADDMQQEETAASPPVAEGRWWDLSSARLARQAGYQADRGDMEAGQ